VNERRTYDPTVRASVEHELKLDLDTSFSLPELPGAELEARTFTSTYHDTPARSLGRAGITLRRRVENGKSLWQLKLPRNGDTGLARTEIEEPGGPAGPPAALARLLAAHLRHGKLEPVATLRTRRSGVRVLDGERALADVTVDTVDVLDAGRAAGGFAEIEIELVDGDEADLKRLGKTLRRAGARVSDGRPKLMRVLELPDAPSSSDPLARMLEAQLRALETHDPGIRLGDDPEDVHKFRVATRRARALIRATRPLLGDTLAPVAAELRWLAGLLGPVRDLDVLIAHLGTQVAALGEDEPAGRELVAGLSAQRDAAQDELLAALSSTRYGELLALFEHAIRGLPRLEPDAVRGIARDELAKLRKATRKLPRDPDDDELHRVRIKAKRARYAAELAGAERVVDALKKVQDVIGEHQDAVVAEARLRTLARAKTAIAAGRLIELERARRHAMRARAPEVIAAAIAAGAKAFS